MVRAKLSKTVQNQFYALVSNDWRRFAPKHVCLSQNCLRHYSSSASRKEKQRVIPGTIALPPYVCGHQLSPPTAAEVKSAGQIRDMLPACKLAASILHFVKENIQVGMETEEIDDLVFSKCVEAGAYPSPLDYKGFPRSVCTSVNEVACHGIPGQRKLRNGDIINIDITVFYKGYHGDTSATFAVGDIDAESRALMQASKACLDAGISVCRDGAMFADIGDVVFETACRAGFAVIPYFCGHGIGTYFHGPPDIVHVPNDNCGTQKMKAGMTFTIEPILCAGDPEIQILNDGWTVVTTDGSRSAQFEHTILVTESGSQVMTSI